MGKNNIKFITIEHLYPDLFKIIPGWLKGVIHTVTAGLGVGKSKFVKYSFVLHGYNYCKQNDMPFYCLYFAHEESVEKFWITIQCDLLQERYGLNLTYYQYKGFHEGKTQEHEDKLKLLEPEIEEMKKRIFVYDHVSNPTGMYRTVQKFMETIGKKINGISEEDDNGNKYQSFNYIYDNPDTQVMVINDHFGLVTPERNPFEKIDNTHAAMKKWSELCVKFVAKKYQCIVVQIHQQDVSGDGQESLKLGRPEPTLDKLGVNKIVGQDSFVVLGLFRPSRVNPPIPIYLDYDVKAFNGKLSILSVLKHRDGDEGVVKPLYFHGITSKFEELPPAYIIDTNNKKIKNPKLNKYYV